MLADGWRPLEADGFIAHVGPLWRRRDGDGVSLGFHVEDKHLNRRGVVQGGMLATLADRAMGLASRLSNDGMPQTTIQLELHYLDAAQLGEFVEARCRVSKRSRYVIFMGADVLAGDRLVATARGIWKVMAVGSGRGREKSFDVGKALVTQTELRKPTLRPTFPCRLSPIRLGEPVGARFRLAATRDAAQTVASPLSTMMIST
jgi:uncharacterized protein (TIGR00369 family)